MRSDSSRAVRSLHGKSGELGNGARTNVSSPVQVTGSWSQIASGIYAPSGSQANASYAINSVGQLFTWGSNQYSGSKVSSPVQISGSWTQIFSGMDGSFGVQPNGTLWGWGDNSWGNVLPAGSSGWPEGSPVLISSATSISGSWLQVSSGGTSLYVNDTTFALAIRSDNTLWGWGVNTCGQLAQTSLSLFRSPIQIAGSWAQIGTAGATDYGYSLGIRSDGTLWTWGRNDNCQLGIGNTTDQSSPVQVSGGGSWIQATGGVYSSFGIKTDGTLWGWGGNDDEYTYSDYDGPRIVHPGHGGR
jgi:alpha-tubulin suppressor-like RCC1 family protein